MPYLIVLGLASLIAAGWWAYIPGLTGTFLFDDFNNLNALSNYGRVDNFKTLLFYLTSGDADPIGRPLSLLTFLIDANYWPADPESFKRTNILLHLLNGILLIWVLLRLGRGVKLPEHCAASAAILGAAFWTLHPFLVSTTLYVVQREAMLPATFTLIGMLFWITGRERYFAQRKNAIPLLVTGAGVCTALAILCKANGILMPLLLLVMEITVLARIDNKDPSARQFKFLRFVLLCLPSAIVMLWLGKYLPFSSSPAPTGRPWTVSQRLITESRVLMHYIHSLWIPRASLSGLFNDAFPASTDLFHPWTTLPALIIICFLIIAAFVLRRTYPILTFAVLFFFSGHLLESTVIPLELYFEHRNYLPAMMMFWPLAIWLVSPGIIFPVRVVLSVTLPVILTVLTHIRAGDWGSPYQQALLFAESEPNSPRAISNAAAYEDAIGRPDLAVSRLKHAMARIPNDPHLALSLIDAECKEGGLDPHILNTTATSVQKSRDRAESIGVWILATIPEATRGNCKGLNLEGLQQVAEALRLNPYFSKGPKERSGVNHIEGRLALARHDGDSALHAFNSALDDIPTPDLALTQAAFLGANGFPKLGLLHLYYFRELSSSTSTYKGMMAVHYYILKREGFWSSELDRLTHQLQLDASIESQRHN